MLVGRICLFSVALTLSANGPVREPHGSAANQQAFFVQPLRIPMSEARPKGLEALLVRPNDSKPHPLAVMTHGAPATAPERAAMTPQRMLPLAVEFARRGWTTVIVMRRAYGTSGGRYAESCWSCENPNYMAPAKESARDLREAIIYLSTLPEVDPQRIIAVGPSVGGLAVTALTANPPPGLVAAINFAGGHGHIAPDTVCQPGNLLSTFWILGKKSRVPMLWVYAKNDHFFNADLAEGLYAEFSQAGGRATFVSAPPFGNEGHSLFTMSGIPSWTRYVDDFLKTQGLILRARPLPILTAPNIRYPSGLSSSGWKGFRLYLMAPEEKAFAMGSEGRWGYEFGRQNLGRSENCSLRLLSKWKNQKLSPGDAQRR
jgi:dienelactone hydrolase